MAKGIEVRQSFTLNVPADVAFAFWRRFSEFPRFMKHVESVTELDDKRSHWVVRGPGDRTVEWDAEIVEEIPGRSIHWRTIGEPDVRHGGQVGVSSGDRGSRHRGRDSPRVRSARGQGRRDARQVFGEDPEAEVREDLRRFKRLLETGEIPTTEGQSSGREDEARAERDVAAAPEVRP